MPVLPCISLASDDRAPNEPDALSPERLPLKDPEFHRWTADLPLLWIGLGKKTSVLEKLTLSKVDLTQALLSETSQNFTDNYDIYCVLLVLNSSSLANYTVSQREFHCKLIIVILYCFQTLTADRVYINTAAICQFKDQRRLYQTQILCIWSSNNLIVSWNYLLSCVICLFSCFFFGTIQIIYTTRQKGPPQLLTMSNKWDG